MAINNQQSAPVSIFWQPFTISVIDIKCAPAVISSLLLLRNSTFVSIKIPMVSLPSQDILNY